MNRREKRVDLRFGGFACSLRGFDDPVEPLTRLLREVQERLGGRAPDAPLFDAATMRRLEAEIAGLGRGGISAVPGLVLRVSEEDEAPEPVGGPGRAARDDAVPEDTVASAVDAEAGAAPAADEAPGAAAAPLTSLPEIGAEAEEPAVNLFEPVHELSPAESPIVPAVNLFDEVAPAAGAGTGAEDPIDPAAGLAEDGAGFDPPPAPAADRASPGTGIAPAEVPDAEPQADPVGTTAEAPESPPPEETVNLFDTPPEGQEAPEADEAPNLFLAEEPVGAVAAEEFPVAGDQVPPAGGNVTPLGSFREPDRPGRRPAFGVVEEDEPLGGSAAGLSPAELARKAGASAPPELIAASAAWLSVVKGHHSFTRREVLEVFDQLPGEHPKTAEAKIKGFGKLLRNAQVEPAAGDRFHLSDAERDRFEDLLG